MRKFWQIIIAGIMLLAVPTIAEAQDSYFDVRVEPGVAVPLNHKNGSSPVVGGAIAIKPEVSIYDVLSLGPSLSFLGFASKLVGIDTPNLVPIGGLSLKIKGPHGFVWNPNAPGAAVSPWLDSDLQYVRLNGKDGLGFALGAGASWPIDMARVFWLGPFARYQDIHQADMAGGDLHTLIFGVSIELDMAHRQPPKPLVPPTLVVVKPVPPKVVPVKHVPDTQEVETTVKQTVQFAWDSDKLVGDTTKQLDTIVAKLTSSTNFKSMKIEGHASSEGPVVYNDKLSLRRASSVMNYLIAHGVPAEKLSAVGFGSRVPVASNATEAGRIKNRRVEFVVDFTVVTQVAK